LLRISKLITKPNPGTKSLPFGTSIALGVSCFVSLLGVATTGVLLTSGLDTVGDDCVLVLSDETVVCGNGVGPISTGAVIGTST
jgi:hypothetical protein